MCYYGSLLENIPFLWKGKISQIARFMRPTWGPPGSCRPPGGPHVRCYQGLHGNYDRWLKGIKLTIRLVSSSRWCGFWKSRKCIYSVLLIHCGKFSLKNSGKTPHILPEGDIWGVICKVWLNFYHCNFCAVLTMYFSYDLIKFDLKMIYSI